MLSQTFRIWGEMLRVGHIAYVTINCGQHQWVSFLNISLKTWLRENITRKLLSHLKIFLKSLLFNVAILTFCAI